MLVAAMSDAPEPLRELLDGLSDLAQSLATMVETLKSLRGELIDAVATIDPGAEQAHDDDASA